MRFEGIVDDIDDRQRAEEALRASAARLRLLTEQVPALIWSTDSELRFTDLTGAGPGRVGLRPSQVLGSSVTEYFGTDDMSCALVVAHARALRGESVEFETGWRGRRFRAHVEPLWEPSGRVAGTVGVAVDVTERVTLHQALGRAQDLATLGSLVAGVAHEVRNPLFSISATLDAFEVKLGNSEGVRPYTAALRKAVRRLNDLMGDLLEYGRPQSSDLAPGSLAGVLQEAVESCQSLATRAGVAVCVRAPADLPFVAMERRRLMLVFRNLVENAILHSAPGGAVEVAAMTPAPSGPPVVECTVRDHGPGFRDEDLPRIFEPFYTRRRGGTGLGLSIAQRIVDEHHGRVSAFNHAEGGAAMSVRLPCAGPAGSA